MKLNKTLKYEGKMTLMTGMAIKGANDDLNIGGADSEVVKNPITGMPYIPGSSLKGKMRSLLEINEGKFFKKKDGQETGGPCNCGNKDCLICTLFGAHQNPNAKSAPTRIIVRDCSMDEASIYTIDNMPLDKGNYLELKAENSINRKSGTAESPRFIERIPAGLSFNVEIMLNVFDGDNEKKMVEEIDKGIRLVENSYLGGSGTRGYGQVKFEGKWMKFEPNGTWQEYNR